jgi:hypothetical protein
MSSWPSRSTISRSWGQEVLDHEPLHAGGGELGDLRSGLIRRADDPALLAVGQPHPRPHATSGLIAIGAESTCRAVEHRQKAITRCIDLLAPEAGDLATDHRVMIGEEVGPPTVTKLGEAGRGADDIRVGTWIVGRIARVSVPNEARLKASIERGLPALRWRRAHHSRAATASSAFSDGARLATPDGGRS